MPTVPGSYTDDYQEFQLALQDSLGIVVGEESRGQIEGRLQPLMLREQLGRLSDLAVAMRDDKPAHIRQDVLAAITTHSSGWFRYPDIHRLVSGYVLPSLIDKQVNECRFWYVGCGHGEGAWSLAMTTAETLEQLGSEMAFDILATDASRDAIEFAKRGVFPESGLEGLAQSRRERFLMQEEEGFSVDGQLRDRVHFKTCDLLSEALQQGHFDVIVSPDLLMYFSVGLKRQILDDFAALLDPSGILILNNGEAVIPLCDRFELVEHEIATFYRQVS